MIDITITAIASLVLLAVTVSSFIGVRLTSDPESRHLMTLLTIASGALTLAGVLIAVHQAINYFGG